MRRQITPGTAGARDPENRLKKKPVVAAAAAGIRRLPQTMRLQLRPLGVCQYVSIHPKLESQTSLRWNPEPQQALDAWCGFPRRERSHFLKDGGNTFLDAPAFQDVPDLRFQTPVVDLGRLVFGPADDLLVAVLVVG